MSHALQLTPIVSPWVLTTQAGEATTASQGESLLTSASLAQDPQLSNQANNVKQPLLSMNLYSCNSWALVNWLQDPSPSGTIMYVDVRNQGKTCAHLPASGMLIDIGCQMISKTS